MTEDATFEALKRPSYYQMYELWGNSPICKARRLDLDAAEKFFKMHNWTMEEYNMYLLEKENKK